MKYLQITLNPVTAMLRDIQPITPNPNSLDVEQNHEVGVVLSLIDRVVPDFRTYYIKQGASKRENRISDLLIHFLQVKKAEYHDGFAPYDIRKNPTQVSSGREADIGVFIKSLEQEPLLPIFEIEAKLLSQSSNNKEYVCGERGGIERFKRKHHAPHLSTCGMFGYILDDTTSGWVSKINGWISSLSNSSNDDSIDWTNRDEMLVSLQSFSGVEKLKSHNYRKESNDSIMLYHYLIGLN